MLSIPAILNRALDTLLPPRCAITGAVVDRPGALAPDAWKELRFIGAPQCAICGIPFDFTVESAMDCAACLREKPLYASARAALVYDDGSRGIILKFKHADRLDTAQTLAGWMHRAGAEMLQSCDLLIPVPLHRWRLLRRRYNQAALLAALLGKRSGKPDLPDALIRRRHTAIQGHKGFKDRHRNVRGAFAAHPKRAGVLQGKTIVLIDDVHTSGATIRECTKTLLKAGAGAVHVLTAARVVKAE